MRKRRENYSGAGLRGGRREARSPPCEGKLIIYYYNKAVLCPTSKFQPIIPRKAE